MNQPRKQKPTALARWYRGHVRAMREGWIMPIQTPWQSLFTVITLGICFYLPLVMWTVWQNFDSLEQQWQSKGSMAVFLKPGIKVDELTNLQHDLNEQSLISNSYLVTGDQIKSQLNDDPQLNQIITIIETQELPDQIFLTPHPNATNQQLDTLSQKLQLNPHIDYVSFDVNWFNQLQALTHAFFYLMQASITIFMVIILVFLSHSIGNEVANHKKEITLLKLLGAHASQIRRRFLYGGIYYGMMSGCLALLLLFSTLWWIATPISDLSSSFGYNIELNYPNISTSIFFVTTSTAITWLGIRISASNHIQQI